MKNFTKKEITFITTLVKMIDSDIDVLCYGNKIYLNSVCFSERIYFILKQINDGKLVKPFYTYLISFDIANKYAPEPIKNRRCHLDDKEDTIVYLLKS